MKKYLLSALIASFLGICCGKAQTVYSNPSPLQESSQGVEIFFNATGTPLAGLSATTKIYAHTGVYTNLSPNNWKNAPEWGNNSSKYELSYVSTNLWRLYIGDIRTYYNITNPSEQVTDLLFVFRNAGKTQQTGDLSLPVYADGLQVSVTSNRGNVINEETAYVKFTVSSTLPANLELLINNQSIASATNTQTLTKEYLFTSQGDYTVTAKATANGETVTEKLSVVYVKPGQPVNYPGGTPKMGPVANADGSVTFCLGAIEKEQVILVGSWNDYAYTNSQVMNYQDTSSGRYFWTTVSGLDPKKQYIYYFVIDGGKYTVSDPYARLVIDPWNDEYIDNNTYPNLPEYPARQMNGVKLPLAVYQGNINDYNWQCTDFEIPDKDNLIIYELLFRDFTGTEGAAKGNGTVRQAIKKLPYLINLGVNVIEVLPIMEFNGNISWGYNPNFYFAIDKAYGTPDDYKEFIDLCHQNGIAVVLDMVFNQSDGLHPWFQMYPSGSNPYYNSTAPHAYSVLNDWNQGNPMVQEQWADVLRYWMTEYKFDGFRFDLVKGLGLNSSYANNGDAATNNYNATRVEEMLYLQSVMMEVNPDAIFINENLAYAREENEMSQTSFQTWGNMQLNWSNMNNAACEFAMGWPSASNLNGLYAPNNDNRIWGSTVSYLESHDEERLAYKQNQYGVQTYVKGNVEASMRRLGSAAAQMIMTPGSHMIWQFSEMGNAQTTKNSNGGNDTDPKIVNWALLEEPNHRGLHNNYRQLINVRLKNPEFFTKDAQFTMNCSSTNWSNGTTGARALISKTGDKELITIINPNYGNGSLTYSYSFNHKDNSAYQELIHSYNTTPAFDAVKGTITVPANSFVVIGSASLVPSGIDNLLTDNEADSFRAFGNHGEIVIEGASEGAFIYSLDGKVAGKTNENGKISMAPGMYIVNSGNAAIKVIVK